MTQTTEIGESVEIITSHQNNKIKLIRSLSQRKYREEHGLFIIEGKRSVQELLDFPDRIGEIFLSESFYSENKDLLDSPTILSDQLFDQISSTVTPQGILATVRFAYLDMTDVRPGRYIYTDRIQDPGNLGTIIRSVDGLGLEGVIIGPGTVDPTNDKVVRGSMASILRTDIYRSKGIVDLESLKKTHNLKATVLTEDSQILKDIDKDQPQIIIIGNEGAGVSQDILDIVDETIYIPMTGRADSLNAGVAASIVMYELVR